MMQLRAGLRILPIIILCILSNVALAQCPSFPTASIMGNNGFMCEGDMLTISLTGQNIPSGSSVDFYLGSGMFNPYDGEGDPIGSVMVTSGGCDNLPEVLYVMVNPDNTQVGSGNDKCDEFMVIWTGSGNFSTSDIIVSNLSNGSFQWNDFVAGNAASFSCGVSLPPGPVPENAILIIQGAYTNNVFVNSDVLCASGLPVYIIANNNTLCTGGWFDNDSPCASCPVQIDINGSGCDYAFDVDYGPPATSTNGWGWSNMGTGVFANVVPPLDFPVYDPPVVTIPDFIWTVPANYCENYGEGVLSITGILDPPPVSCPEIFTPFFDINVSCPQLMISGGGDICEGNCPDAPNEIVFTITGNDVPFIADLQITAPLFPPFMIDDLEIFNGQQLFICLEGFLPSFDPTTNTLTIPTLVIGMSATVQIVSIESASGCPVTVDPGFITINFIAAVTADAGPDQTICSHENAFLEGNIGGSADNAMWSTNGDGTFTNPANATTTYIPGAGDKLNGSVILTLTATDDNGACIPAESTVEITIEPSLIIDLGPPLTICNTDVANIEAMLTGPNEPGQWETSGDGTFDDPNDPITIYTPGNGDLNNGSVQLFYAPVNANVCVVPIEPLIITFVDAPIVNVPTNIEVCSEDSITIHINVNGNFTDINWSTIGDGVLLIINDVEVNYTPGPEDIANQFTIVSVTVVSAYPECGQTTYNMGINVVDCDCPPFVTTPPPAVLCGEAAILDLSTLLAAGGSGGWSITSAPGGSNPATVIGNSFVVDSSDAGVYTVTYTLDAPDPGCSATSSESVFVSQFLTISAGANIANCGPANVFINGTVIPFGSATVMWETLGDGSFVNPSTLATTYVPGPNDSTSNEILLVLHLIDPVCGNETDTTSVLFPAPPFALFIDDTVAICNEAANGSIINFPSLITGGDNSGTWSNTGGAPVNFSDPANVNFDGVAEGIYIFSYQTNSAQFPCQNVNYTIAIEVEECSCPMLQIQSLPGGICNSQDSINLAAFIIAGGSGSWSVVNQPAGSNPATISGSFLRTFDTDQGDYTLRFTLDAAPIIGCPDSAEINVFIQENPLIMISGDTLLCSNDSISLSANLGGSSSGLQWASDGSGGFTHTSSVTAVYQFSQGDILNGQVTITATTSDNFGFCQPAVDSLQVTLTPQPFAVFSQLSTDICNNPDSGSIVDLMAFLIGGDIDGVWNDVDGSGVDVTFPAAVDFVDVAPGSYNFIYTTNDAFVPCLDSSYQFTVIVEDCACPLFQFGTIADIICAATTLNLNALIIDAGPGDWSIYQGPSGANWPAISGNTMNTANADAGNYILAYTLADSIPGCPATNFFPFSLEREPTLAFGIPDCDEAQMVYSVGVTTDAFSLTVDFGNVTLSSPGNFIIESIPGGQNIIIEAASSSGTCTSQFSFNAPDCDCTLMTEDISDTIFVCPGDTFVLIPFLTGAQGLAFSTWVSEDETLMRPTLPLYEANTWIWILRDSAGCELRDTFNVALKELIIVDALSLPPTCEGLSDGAIIITDITGGQGPYEIQFDNFPSFISSSFPDTLEDVGVGIHTLSVSNQDGCETKLNMQVNDVSPGNLTLGPDESIVLGDSILITPVLEGIAVMDFIWDPINISPDIEQFWFTPESTTLISLMITDSLGCIYEDQVLITVLLDQKFYVPNIFSPNGDQYNDLLEISTTIGSDPVISMEIFDRWGNMVYVQEGNSPYRWNGLVRGKEAMPGVYVIKILFRDENGNTLVHVSDLTLIR